MIKAVLFDYGGVVAGKAAASTTPTKIPIYRDPSLEKAALEIGVSYHLLHPIMESYLPPLQRGEIMEKEVWKLLAQQHNFTIPEDAENLLAREITKIYSQNEDVLDLIQKIKAAGVNVGVLSNTVESHVRHFEQEKRYDLFDTVTLSCQVGARKPEEKMYLIGLHSFEKVMKNLPEANFGDARGTFCPLHVNPAECVFIDDVERFVAAALEIGLKGIHFRYGVDSTQDLATALKNQGLSF